MAPSATDDDSVLLLAFLSTVVMVAVLALGGWLADRLLTPPTFRAEDRPRADEPPEPRYTVRRVPPKPTRDVAHPPDRSHRVPPRSRRHRQPRTTTLGR